LAHLAQQKRWHLPTLFAQQPERAKRLSIRLGPLYADFSRQRWDDAVIAPLVSLAEACGLPTAIEALFEGQLVNVTEGRAALHTALRQQTYSPVWVNGENVIPLIRQQQAKMARLVDRLHAGHWRGYSGRAITDVVHLGVGGSDLGPQLVVDALAHLKHPACRLNLHFVSNLDGGQLERLLPGLNPETTLFVITSKTFTTIDTLANADTALSWLQGASKLAPAVLKRLHFVGISAAPERMDAWGLPKANQLHFWDWVGGRYSLWSTVGFTIALWLGMDGFHQLLAGAAAMDDHFRSAPLAQNIPVLMGLVGVWNHNFLGMHARAVLPYDVRLTLLPRYLMQLEMESNGKSVRRDGTPCPWHTSPVVWGETGPNAQHAFYQLLHQGTEAVSCDFIAVVSGDQSSLPPERAYHHQHLNLANCLAQLQALAFGRQHEDPHRAYPGNRPATLLLLQRLDAYTMGMLIALYEHMVFTQSVIWDINPFDQWGVELGKRIAGTMKAVLDGRQDAVEMDAATEAALQQIRTWESEA
jgi:glucose-6-phosphate isomerase